MAERLSRMALYDLVWSQPMKTLAARFGISDVTLKKSCARAAIPVPNRGYWAKKEAGKSTSQAALPPRPPGMNDEVLVGGGGQYGYGYSNLTKEEIRGPLPPLPEFEEPLEAVRARIADAIGTVPSPRNVRAWHPVTDRLLKEDERRREKQSSSSYVLPWEAPRFDSPFERRRLRILNSLFLATARMGGRPSVRGDKGREVYLTFNQRHVQIELDRLERPRKRVSGQTIDPDHKETALRLSVGSERHSDTDGLSWQDEEAIPLENHLTQIAIEIALMAERQYRNAAFYLHEWRVKQKAQLEEEERQRRLEAERAERKRRAALEQARVDRLLRGAAALRQATDLRAYVEAVRSAVQCREANINPADLERWIAWALAQADRIDPVRSQAFLNAMKDDDQNAG